MKLQPIFKTSGCKSSICKWIIDNFPEDYQSLNYLEPYCGCASVLLNKEPSKIEAINDLNLDLIQMFRALREEPKTLFQKLKKIKCTEQTFNKYYKNNGDFENYLDHAISEAVLRKMSRGGFKRSFYVSLTETPEIIWNQYIENLKQVSKRLQDIYIFNKSGVEVIKSFNNYDTLVYCDPPNVEEESEMTIDNHTELRNALFAFKGKVVITNNRSTIYKRLYKDWQSVKIADKPEMLWKNF